MTVQNVPPDLCKEVSSRKHQNGARHRISIEGDHVESGAATPAPARTDKKLNLRIRKEDNLLLKALAEQAGTTNSALLNKLLHALLLEDLLKFEEKDARALLAAEADRRASYDDFERPWVMDVAGHFARFAIENALEWNELDVQVQPPDLEASGLTMADLHSDLFNELKRRLESKR